MDFQVSERMQAALALIRTFVDRELVPLETAFLTRPFRNLLPELEKKRAKVKQMGLWAPGHPAELGGMGLDLVDLGLVSEALGLRQPRAKRRNIHVAPARIRGDMPRRFFVRLHADR